MADDAPKVGEKNEQGHSWNGSHWENDQKRQCCDACQLGHQWDGQRWVMGLDTPGSSERIEHEREHAARGAGDEITAERDPESFADLIEQSRPEAPAPSKKKRGDR